MRRLRQIHNLLGAFFAPAILFFAFTGALQTFSLHEAEEGGAYQPPGWIVMIASVHKDQRLPRPKPPEAAHHHHEASEPEAHEAPAAPTAKPPSPLPLKIFVLTLAIGLMATALMGLYIALKNRATRRDTLIMIALGTLLPIILLFL